MQATDSRQKFWFFIIPQSSPSVRMGSFTVLVILPQNSITNFYLWHIGLGTLRVVGGGGGGGGEAAYIHKFC